MKSEFLSNYMQSMREENISIISEKPKNRRLELYPNLAFTNAYKPLLGYRFSRVPGAKEVLKFLFDVQI